MTDTYNGLADGFHSFTLGVAAIREIAIRRHDYPPEPGRPHELRWWREGRVKQSELDTLA